MHVEYCSLQSLMFLRVFALQFRVYIQYLRGDRMSLQGLTDGSIVTLPFYMYNKVHQMALFSQNTNKEIRSASTKYIGCNSYKQWFFCSDMS